MTQSKTFTLSQLNGRIGELEFALFLEKMIFDVSIPDLVYPTVKERKAKFFPIAIQGSSDHGIDFDTELCWVENEKSIFAGMHVFVQVKTHITNISFEAADFEYYERLYNFVPVLIIWQRLNSNGEIAFRKVISYSKIRKNHKTLEKIQKVRFGEQTTASFDIELWESFDEVWCGNYIKEAFLSIESSILDGIYSSMLGAANYIEGFLVANDYIADQSYGEKFKTNQYFSKLYTKDKQKILVISTLYTQNVLIPDLTMGGRGVGVINKVDPNKILSQLVPLSGANKIIYIHGGHVLDLTSPEFRACMEVWNNSFSCPFYYTELFHIRSDSENLKKFII